MTASDSPREQVRAWRPDVPGVSEVFHARFTEHAYPAHTHDQWTVLLVDSGGVLYDLERSHHDADRRAVTVLPPQVPHDGRAATADGFRKRVLYLEPDWLPEAVVGAAVAGPALADRALVDAVSALHGAFGRRDDLEAESRLALLRERVLELLPTTSGRHSAPASPPRLTSSAYGARLAHHVRARLDADLADAPTLAELATGLAVDPTAVVRAFGREFGISPHRYLTGRRVDAARRLLLEGRTAAEVAAQVGFHDQPHLTRHFRRLLGVTPGAYASSVA